MSTQHFIGPLFEDGDVGGGKVDGLSSGGSVSLGGLSGQEAEAFAGRGGVVAPWRDLEEIGVFHKAINPDVDR